MEKQINKRKIRLTIIGILLSMMVSVVFSAFFTQFIPSLFIGKYQLEFIVIAFIIFICLIALWIYFKKIYYITASLLVFFSLVLLFGQIGWTGISVINNAYNNINPHSKNSSKVNISTPQKVAMPHISLQQRIQQKVNYKDSVVRDFAVEHSLLYFEEYYTKYRQICRQFSLIKYIRNNYKYVTDPSGFDYFASPQESIQLMAGDCDDYTILMASTLKAIGCDVRIVWAPKHVYPEMYCGSKSNFEKYINAIYTLFPDEIAGKEVFYRLDKNEDYWLNLDYTDRYPGSAYLSEEVLSFIYIK